MRHRPALRSGIAEARQVHRDRPMPRRRERLQMHSPHAAIRDAGVQQNHRRPITGFVVWELHRSRFLLFLRLPLPFESTMNSALFEGCLRGGVK
jgi:hypothetical protein